MNPKQYYRSPRIFEPRVPLILFCAVLVDSGFGLLVLGFTLLVSGLEFWPVLVVFCYLFVSGFALLVSGFQFWSVLVLFRCYLVLLCLFLVLSSGQFWVCSDVICLFLVWFWLSGVLFWFIVALF